MGARMEMTLEAAGGTLRLLSPGVGLFTGAVPEGHALTPGQGAGHLLVLGRPVALVVPGGAAGVVRSRAPEPVHQPVGYGSVLYELGRLETAGSSPPAPEARGEREDGGLVFRAPRTGRFWHRSAPGEPPFAIPGQVLSAGDALGLIEVMKTFTRVPYRPSGALPERARVVRLVAGDGEDVAEGAPLVALEPA